MDTGAIIVLAIHGIAIVCAIIFTINIRKKLRQEDTSSTPSFFAEEANLQSATKYFKIVNR